MGDRAKGVPDDTVERVIKYTLIKARRYRLPTVHLSDVQVYLWSTDQIDRLHTAVAEAGFTLKLGHHTYGPDFNEAHAERVVPRFGDVRSHK